MTICSLGNLQSILGYYKEAIEIYRKLEGVNPGLFKKKIEELEEWVKDFS